MKTRIFVGSLLIIVLAVLFSLMTRTQSQSTGGRELYGLAYNRELRVPDVNDLPAAFSDRDCDCLTQTRSGQS